MSEFAKYLRQWSEDIEHQKRLVVRTPNGGFSAPLTGHRMVLSVDKAEGFYTLTIEPVDPR